MTVNVFGRFTDLFSGAMPAGMRGVAALTVFSVGTSLATAQVVKAPRYQSPVEAPTPQLSLPAPPPAITPHGTVVEDIVVRVNDQIITRSDVERQMEQLAQAAQQPNAPRDRVADEQKNMLRDMIDQQLLLSRAKELGLNADAEVIRQLDDIRKKNGLDSMDALAAAARKEGINFEDFKAQIRNQVLTQMVVRDEVGRKIQMSEGEARKYYEEHKAEFAQPEQVRLSEILIPTPENATQEQLNQAQAKANNVKAELEQGADFAALARKYSGGPSANQGGELGLFKRGALAKVLEDQTFPLKAGETTSPIRTRQGFVILKVTQHQAEGPAPMQDVMPQIEEAMYMQQMQPALRRYLTKLREESYVLMAPGFVDTGASTNETVPVYTAYAPPAVKKKAQKAKTRFDRAGYGKKPSIDSPDTTGSRTITGADAPKPGVDPATGLAVVSSPTKPGKHMRREKIRFGQAPRNTLSGGAADAATTEVAGAAPAVAPGAVIASNGAVVTNPETANLDDNPLTAQAPERKKTRFAATYKEVQAKRASTLTSKQQEKIIATPVKATPQDHADEQQQAAPLGFAGDTGKKKKTKVKREKGQPKERLQDKPVTPVKTETTPVEQTANPALAPVSVQGISPTVPPPAGTVPPSDGGTPATKPPQE